MTEPTYAELINRAAPQARPLSRREWLVWACIVAGMTRGQAGESLGISVETVATYLKRVHIKLGTTGRGRTALDRPVDHD